MNWSMKCVRRVINYERYCRIKNQVKIWNSGMVIFIPVVSQLSLVEL